MLTTSVQKMLLHNLYFLAKTLLLFFKILPGRSKLNDAKYIMCFFGTRHFSKYREPVDLKNRTFYFNLCHIYTS